MMHSAILSSGLPGRGLFDPDDCQTASGEFTKANREQCAAPHGMMFAQSLRYVDDLVQIYELEKSQAQALETATALLTAEKQARLSLEKELRSVKREFERELALRTRELETTNARLQEELRRRRLLDEHLRQSLRRMKSQVSETRARVRDDLQAASNLLDLHATQSKDEAVLAALTECGAGLRAMALAYEDPMRPNHESDVRFSEYVHNLVKLIIKTYWKSAGSVDVSIQCDSEALHQSQAVPCGLIINELVTNSLKHAFGADAHGKIRITFRGDSTEGFVLTVADNGNGFPPDFQIKSCKTLGLKLATNLAELQLAGLIRFENDNGAKVTVEIPVKKAVGGSSPHNREELRSTNRG